MGAYLYSFIEPYLSPEALKIKQDLVAAGADPDLAAALLEVTLEEKDLYDLDVPSPVVPPWID